MATGASLGFMSFSVQSGKYPHEYLLGELRERVRVYMETYRRAALLRTGKVTPNTVKVYLVGSTRAGKTTFALAIAGHDDTVNALQRTPGIDILEIYLDGFGLLKVYDVAGHDLFHTTHSFFFGGASALFVYFVDTERSKQEMEDDAIHWLAFILSGRSPRYPVPHIMILGSRGEGPHRNVRQIKLRSVTAKILEKFEGRFVFHGDPLSLDMRESGSEEMGAVKRQLVAGANLCLKFVPEVPLVCHLVRQEILPEIRREVGAQKALDAGITPSRLFTEKSEFHLLVEKVSDTLKEPSMFAQLLDYLDECGEIVVAGSRVVVNTLSLCRGIIAPVMASKADETSSEFQIRMEAKPDGTATLDDIISVWRDFIELNGTPAVDPSAGIDILCHMGLAFPTKDAKYRFPALIQDHEPDRAWKKTEFTSSEIPGMVYVGVRLQCQSDIEIFSPAVMPLLQCQIATQEGEMMVIMWNGGMVVERVCEVGQPKVEALVSVSDKTRAIRALDLIVRGPAYCQSDVKQFLDRMQQITMQILDRKSPGTRVEKRYLSHQHIRQHKPKPISYTQNEVDSAKQSRGVVTGRIETEIVQDSVIDLLAVEDDHIIYKLQALIKHCSCYWLELGRDLLQYTEDQVRDMSAGLGDKNSDRFCHMMETWIQTQWRTATLDRFLKACDRVIHGLRQQVEKELGLATDTANGTPPPEQPLVTKCRTIRAVLAHGSSRWYSLGIEMKFPNDQILRHTHDKPSPSDKLLALIVAKANEVGMDALKSLVLEACRNITDPIIGHVETDLGKTTIATGDAKRVKLGTE